MSFQDKCPDCGFTGGHAPDCTYGQKQPAPPQKMMRVILAQGSYIDIGPLPADFNFQGAMNTIRLSGAWLSDNMFVMKEQIGAVFCFEFGGRPPTVSPPEWTKETGTVPQ